jgi:hypothetical protein
LKGGYQFILKNAMEMAAPEFGVAPQQPNCFGLRREAKRHAALAALLAVEKRCRRRALPPHSKILAGFDDSDG